MLSVTTFSLKMWFRYRLWYRSKVPANLGFGFSIGPKTKWWFPSYNNTLYVWSVFSEWNKGIIWYFLKVMPLFHSENVLLSYLGTSGTVRPIKKLIRSYSTFLWLYSTLPWMTLYYVVVKLIFEHFNLSEGLSLLPSCGTYEALRYEIGLPMIGNFFPQLSKNSFSLLTKSETRNILKVSALHSCYNPNIASDTNNDTCIWKS